MTNPIIEGIRNQVSTAPDSVAVRWQGRDFTYAELDAQILARVDELGCAGLSSEALVAVEAVRGLDTVIDVAALWSVGLGALLFPAGSEQSLIDGMVQRGRAITILQSAGGPLLVARETAPRHDALAGNILILPTSGSTGEPKLVPLSGAAIASFLVWAEQTFELSRRQTLSFAPLNFDLSLFEVWAVLANGGSVEIVSDADAQNPFALRSLLRQSSVDLIQGVPFVFKSLAAPLEEDPLCLAGVRDVITTGSSLDREARLLMANIFPRARFHNMYGSTETNNSFMASFDTGDFVQWDTLPIGSPLPRVEVALREESGEIFEGPGSGELMVRTPFMMSRYVGLSAPGEAAGITSLFPTGDFVRRDTSGVYHLEARNSRIVKIRGNRISLDQVEASINSHSAVEESVVVAMDDDPAPKIVALVKTHEGAGLSPLALRVHCSKLLPPYALPSLFQMVDMPFPRTSTDKVDRKLTQLTHLQGALNA